MEKSVGPFSASLFTAAFPRNSILLVPDLVASKGPYPIREHLVDNDRGGHNNEGAITEADKRKIGFSLSI